MIRSSILIKHKLGLYFPSLITQLCIRAGVQYNNDEETQYPKKPLDDSMISMIKATRRQAHEEGAAAARPLPLPRPLTIAKRLEHLEI